jgi:nickel transport system substrate-binding protein
VEARELPSVEGVQLLVGDPDTTVVLGFNPRSPLADRAVRVAVARALDSQALTAALYGSFGQPATTFFPSSVPGSGEPVGERFDPDAARAALDDAGWVVSGDGRAKDGQRLELDLLVSGEAAHGTQDWRTLAEAVASALQEVGIGVSIRTVDGAAYLDAVDARDWDLWFSETYGAPYDPAATVVGSFIDTGGGYHLWATPELEELVDTAVFAMTDAERATAYQAMFDYLGAEAAFVPLTQPSRLWAVGPAVSGFEVPVTETDFDLRAVTVSR